MYSRVYRPEVFQGNLNKEEYFEGYYFKMVSEDQKQTFILIPGVVLGEDSHAFIQILMSQKPYTHYIRFELDEFSYERDKLFIKIGQNLFTQSYVRLYIDVDNLKICGMIWFDALQTVDNKWWRPGVMGPFRWLPFMPYYHGVVSMAHALKGSLNVGERAVTFSGGRGYIEKGWGGELPKSYFWVQSNQFDEESLSIMIAIARIPLLKCSFKSCLVCLTINEKTRVFANYTGMKVKKFKVDEEQIYLLLKQKQEKIEVIIDQKNTHNLVAPVKGRMEREVAYTVDAKMSVKLYYRNRLILQKSTQKAVIELGADIKRLVKE